MAFSEALAERIRQALARHKYVEEKKMFGGVGFLLHGNILVGVWKDSLIVRLGPDQAEEALLEPHVKEFDITGRPMKGWMLVEPEGVEDDEQLSAWIQRATKFVGRLPGKWKGQEHGDNMAKPKKAKDIDGYISQFPADVQAILQKLRTTISSDVPEATETISYMMPAFRQHGILVYFAAWEKHIGMYPPISGDKTLEKAIARYAGPKGNLQFPLDEPMPFDLIERIVKLRAKQDTAKAAAKRKTRR
jgi:uncharacterized protein YdhG (YjbR/CyaY superfamily)/TfoX/Sxy family transcriptional regulator of competence genes